MTTIISGRITTDDTTAYITMLHNPAMATITSVDKVPNVDGQFVVTIDKDILNSDAPPKWYIADSQNHKYVVSAISQNQFSIAQYEADGTEKDGIISGGEFQIVNY